MKLLQRQCGSWKRSRTRVSSGKRRQHREGLQETDEKSRLIRAEAQLNWGMVGPGDASRNSSLWEARRWQQVHAAKSLKGML